MANYSALKAAVQAAVKTNGNQEITGANMQATLLSIIDSLGNGYQLMGVATPSTTPPSSPDYNIAYIAGAGSYTNFGTAVVIPPTNIAIFKYNGSWACEQVTVENGGVFDITAYNNNTTYADLAAALGTNGANVPESVRKGGMSVKFVCSSDNKYVQFRYMGTDTTGSPNPFLDTNNWCKDFSFIINVNEINSHPLTYSSVRDARRAVPACLRFNGAIITYLRGTQWLIEQFISDDITEWEDNSAWSQISHVNGYEYMGVALPSTVPVTKDRPIFYIAFTNGTYTNFDNLVVKSDNMSILYWDGNWHIDAPQYSTNTPLGLIEPVLRQGTKNSTSNSKAITSTYITPIGKSAKAYAIISKPAPEGCEWRYGFCTFADNNGETLNSSYIRRITASSGNSITFQNGENGFCIEFACYDTVNQQDIELPLSAMDGYTVYFIMDDGYLDALNNRTQVEIESEFHCNTWIEGYIKATTGELKTLGLHIIDSSDYIDIQGCKTIKCSLGSFGDGANGFAFYNASKTYISGTGTGITGNGYENMTIPVPDNARYIRISRWVDDTYDNKYYGPFYIVGMKMTALPSVVAKMLEDEAKTQLLATTQSWNPSWQRPALVDKDYAIKYGAVLTSGGSGSIDEYQAECPCVFWSAELKKYVMTYSAYNASQVGVVGYATSDDLINWTKQGTLLSGTGVEGDADSGNLTGATMFIENGIYYLFYVGYNSNQYEEGDLSICVASTPSLTNPNWTRYGAIIHPHCYTPSGTYLDYIYRPYVVKKGERYYLFFNASVSGHSTDEMVFLAESDSLTQDWILQPDIEDFYPDVPHGPSHPHIRVGDPCVIRQDGLWYMVYLTRCHKEMDDEYSSKNAVADYAVTTDEQFPYGWKYIGQSFIPSLQSDRSEVGRSSILQVGEKLYHYSCGKGNNGGSMGFGIVLQVHAFKKDIVRPLSAPVGTTIFDSTLGKPIWYNGTNWVDATGATV